MTDRRGQGSGPAAGGVAGGGAAGGGLSAADVSHHRTWAAADLVTPALDAVVEGAWLALVYAAVQLGLVHGDATLGAFPFAIAAGVGVAWARPGGGRRTGGAGMLAALVIGAGAIGWLSDPASRAALAAAAQGGWATDAVGTAIATNIGGWLLGVAVLRGATHASRSRDEERIGAMLEWIPLLAIPWAIGLAFSLARRPEFVASALLSTLLFVGGGLVAVGLGHLESFGPAGGVDWRRNRAWLAVVGGVVALLLAVAVPAAYLVGAPPAAIVDAMFLPLAAIVGALAAVAAVIGAPLLAAFESLMAALPEPAPTPPPSASPPPVPGGGIVAPVEGDPRVGLTIAIIMLVATALIVMYVALRIRATDSSRAVAAPATRAPEDRSFVVPTIRARMPRAPWADPLRRPPRTAPEAYLTLLDDLAGDRALARRANESARAHGRRVIASGILAGVAGGDAPPPARAAAPDVDLGLLVADWELARYGARTLTPSEDRRGVGRWRRLRAAARTAAARRRRGAR